MSRADWLEQIGPGPGKLPWALEQQRAVDRAVAESVKLLAYAVLFALWSLLCVGLGAWLRSQWL